MKSIKNQKLKILSSFLTLILFFMQISTVTAYAVPADVVKFSDSNLEAAIRSSLNKSTGDITEGDMEALTYLNLIGSNVTNLDGLQYAKHLRYLNASNCGISDISYLNELTELMEIDIGFNNISDISSLAGATNLSTINLNNNDITDISALSNKLQLVNLNLDNNKIADISLLSSDVNIAVLTLNHNSIDDISAVSTLVNLTNLRLTNNIISNITPVNTLNNLTDLYLSDNAITDISAVTNLFSLKSLYLSNNKIEDIASLGGLNTLEYLYLSNNEIDAVDSLVTLNKLREINLANNRITNIDALSGIVNSNLNFVNLNGNTLPDIMALTGVSPLAQVNFEGYWKVKYFDENNNLIEPETVKNVSIANWYTGNTSRTFDSKEEVIENAKTFVGYSLNDDASKSITLSSSMLNNVIEFHYVKNINDTGSITIKYQDEDNVDIIVPKVLNNLTPGTYTEEYKDIEGYVLNDNTSKTVTLTSLKMHETIIFNYKELKGSLTIKYQDFITGADIVPMIVKSNLRLGSYTETAIILNGYTLYDAPSKSTILTTTNIDETIVFKYKKNEVSPPVVVPDPVPEEPVVKGSYQVKYIDEIGNLLEPVTSYTNLELGKYTEQAKNFKGYSLNDDNSKSIILTEDNRDQIIEFKYKKIKGSYQVKYIDEIGNLLEPVTSYTNLELGKYTEQAKNFKGYSLNDDDNKSIILTEDSRDQTIEFKYKKIKGSYKVKHIDEIGNLLEPITSYTNLELGKYTEQAKSFEGYSLNDDDSKSATLTEDNKEQVIEFKYNRVPAVVELPQTGESRKVDSTPALIILALGSLIFILKRK